MPATPASASDRPPTTSNGEPSYCSNPSCGDSKAVARRLEKLGYADVRMYPGGIQNSVEASCPTEAGLQHALVQQLQQLRQHVASAHRPSSLDRRRALLPWLSGGSPRLWEWGPSRALVAAKRPAVSWVQQPRRRDVADGQVPNCRGSPRHSTVDLRLSTIMRHGLEGSTRRSGHLTGASTEVRQHPRKNHRPY
jgi:hypothetical protein